MDKQEPDKVKGKEGTMPETPEQQVLSEQLKKMAASLEDTPSGVAAEKIEGEGERNVLEVLRAHPEIVDALVVDRKLKNSDELLKEGGLGKIFPGMGLKVLGVLGTWIKSNPGRRIDINTVMQNELGYIKGFPTPEYATDEQLKERIVIRYYMMQELEDNIKKWEDFGEDPNSEKGKLSRQGMSGERIWMTSEFLHDRAKASEKELKREKLRQQRDEEELKARETRRDGISENIGK